MSTEDRDMDRCPTCETGTLQVVDVTDFGDDTYRATYWRIQCVTCAGYVYRLDLNGLPEEPLRGGNTQ